ncbi:MAG: NAD(P)-dependent glycerol-3-phosphate dehydrogenase [Deltaproteobacteria bacterium]|nr:NAD(P)-dependent glycerol-3-phosphate dehydrogenase [Deltaproteobacteria bacterium]
MKKASVIGAGAWGTSLAQVLAQAGFDVLMWAKEEEVVDSINEENQNSIFLKDFSLHKNIRCTDVIDEAVNFGEIIVNAVPTQFIRSSWSMVSEDLLGSNKIVINASKGIEEKTLKLVSMIFEDLFPGIVDDNFAVISGPSFAEEVTKNHPTSVSIAAVNEELAKNLSGRLHLRHFRLYSTSDITGVQLGGALKNVMAIAAGAIDGMGLGFNTRAAMITRGLSEIARLGLEMGACGMTFSGLSGMGDLVLTCTGNLSRNRQVGYRLGKGESVDAILSGMKQVAEGVATSSSGYMLSKMYEVDMPITTAVYSGIFQKGTAKEELSVILDRELKHDGI